MVNEIMCDAMNTVIFDRFCQNKEYFGSNTRSWTMEDCRKKYETTNFHHLEDYLGQKGAVEWGEQLASKLINTPSAMVEVWHDDFIARRSEDFLYRFLKHKHLSIDNAEEMDKELLLAEMVQYLNARYMTLAFNHAEYTIEKSYKSVYSRRILKDAFNNELFRETLHLYGCGYEKATDYSRIIRTTDTTDEDLIAWMEGTLPC